MKHLVSVALAITFLGQPFAQAQHICSRLDAIAKARPTLEQIPKSSEAYKLELVESVKENYRIIFQELLYRAQSQTTLVMVRELKKCENKDLIIRALTPNQLTSLLDERGMEDIKTSLSDSKWLTSDKVGITSVVLTMVGGVGGILFLVSGGELVVIPMALVGVGVGGLGGIGGTVLSHSPGMVRELFVRLTQSDSRARADQLANSLAWLQIESLLGSKAP